MSTADPQPVATYCYRHPDREAYVRCARCNRVICPDCMTAAAVGFHCPECLAEGKASVREARTPFGGRIDTRTPVTFTLIGICVAVFGYQFLAGVDAVVGRWALQPLEIAGFGEWWRLGTAMFLHGSLLHLLFNMYVLYLLGPQLERMLGHVRFLVLYLVAGLGGSVASYAFSDATTYSVGASGAIFGIMAALAVAGRAVGADVRQVLVLIVINLGLGFVVPNVDWRAHLGGLAVGAAAGAVMAYAPRAHRTLVQVVGISLILVVLAAATAVRTSQLQPYAQQCSHSSEGDLLCPPRALVDLVR